MTLVYYDRVKDTTATVGTGTWTLSNSPPSGSVAFSVVGNANTCYYLAYSFDQSSWEIGIGTYTSAGTTLARTTVLVSTNSNNAVNFTVGPTIELVAPSKFFTNALRADTVDQLITGGANVTSFSIGTPGNGSTTTIDCGNAPLQYLTNNVAGQTIAAPSNDGSCILLITNGASAGTVTFSGFTIASSSAGAALTTTNTNKFYVMIWRINSVAGYCILAGQ